MAYGYLSVAGGFTIEGWFRRESPLSGQYEAFVTQYTQANPTWSATQTINGRQFWVGFNPGGSLYIDVYNESGTKILNWVDPSPTGYEDDNQWHFLCVKMYADKLQWRIYIDGETKATVTASSVADWKPGLLTFGGAYAPHLGLYGADLYNGGMAMVAAVNRVLSDNRVLEHYTAGAGGTVYYGDDEVERLTRIYDWTDTPVTCRDFDPPLSVLQGLEVADKNALDALTDAATAAGGYVFADGQSWIQYHNKRHRYNRFSVYNFTENLGAGVEAGLDFIIDEERIFNDVRGKRPYGGSYRMRDSVSIDEYGRRTHEFTLPITSSEELRNTVGWLLSRYGTAHLRVTNVVLRAESSALIEQAATGGVEIGDHIVISDLPDWAPVSSLELTVEGMSMEANFVDKTWAFKMNLTPAEFDTVFQIGVSTLGGDDKVAL